MKLKSSKIVSGPIVIQQCIPYLVTNLCHPQLIQIPAKTSVHNVAIRCSLTKFPLFAMKLDDGAEKGTLAKVCTLGTTERMLNPREILDLPWPTLSPLSLSETIRDCTIRSTKGGVMTNSGVLRNNPPMPSMNDEGTATGFDVAAAFRSNQKQAAGDLAKVPKSGQERGSGARASTPPFLKSRRNEWNTIEES